MNPPSPSNAPPLTAPARSDGRKADQLRPIRFINGIAPHAAGSTLVQWGNTQVICAASIDELVPRWMKDQGISGGWITAEYSMLPYATLQRKPRDISRGKLDGRSTEIQRLIGRAMRAAVHLEKLGPRTLWIDCDVLQADGGTRTAAITGSTVAVALAVHRLVQQGRLKENPLLSPVAGVSVGLVSGHPLLDLCYEEDVAAEVDMNIVMTRQGEFVELQGTGEEATFSAAQLQAMLDLARQGANRLFEAQEAAINTATTP
jgi:ribonuclease PH